MSLTSIEIEEKMSSGQVASNLVSSSGALKQDNLERMTDREFYDHLQSVLTDGSVGVAKIGLEVRLNTDFVETIEELREQRLESLEVFMEENLTQLKEQLEFLKFSLSINI